MDTTKNGRTIKALATVGALALLLSACGGGDDTDTETPAQEPATTEAVTTETDAGAWTAEDEAAFQAEYQQTQEHLLDNYGILDSADFCDSLAAGDTAVVAELAADAGLTWDDDTHLADSGIAEAAYDWCEN